MTPMGSVCPGCAHEEACGHAEVHACAMRDPVEIARLSASAGTTAEEACANVSATAVKLSAAAESPSPWCSCDPLRQAEAERDEWARVARVKQERLEEAQAVVERVQAERDRYREKALSLVCRNRMMESDFDECSECERPDGSYCAAVIEEVDGR